MNSSFAYILPPFEGETAFSLINGVEPINSKLLSNRDLSFSMGCEFAVILLWFPPGGQTVNCNGYEIPSQQLDGGGPPGRIRILDSVERRSAGFRPVPKDLLKIGLPPKPLDIYNQPMAILCFRLG